MPESRYYAWAALDVEGWGDRPGMSQAGVLEAFERVTEQALLRAGIDPSRLLTSAEGDGTILAFPADIPKERITVQFVDVLREAVIDHNARCAGDEEIRLRVALNAGEMLGSANRVSGGPVVAACRLRDSDLLRRVLKASPGSPMAVIVSSEWYDAVIREGYAPKDGYRCVMVRNKEFARTAWVLVPGLTWPKGLTDADTPPPDDVHGNRATPPRAGDAASGSHVDQSVTYGNRYNFDRSTFKGDVVFGDKVAGPDERRERL
jgi:hypothetical protein